MPVSHETILSEEQSSPIKKADEWTNDDNRQFCESLPLDAFYKLSKMSGLDTGKDIDLLTSYLKKADSILELGAGYGRVISKLFDTRCGAQIYALERNTRFCDYLQSRFSDKITIINEDLRKFSTTKKFSTILWLWTGICEFSRAEQPIVIHHLSTLLNTHGYLIIDTLSEKSKGSNATYSEGQFHVIETKYGNDYGYFPAIKEIEKYASQANLHIENRIDYLTDTSHQHCLYILTLNESGFTSP